MTVISQPTPLYQNTTIDSAFYVPSRFTISAVTIGNPTVITTSTDHNFVVGQLVRIIIPSDFGIRQLNEQQAYVISLPSTTQISLDINSNGMDAFVTPVTVTTNAQVLAIGGLNQGALNSSITNLGTFIPGSFRDIS